MPRWLAFPAAARRLRLARDFSGETTVAPLAVRLASGRLTAEMAGVRRVFGFSDSEAHGGYG